MEVEARQAVGLTVARLYIRPQLLERQIGAGAVEAVQRVGQALLFFDTLVPNAEREVR